ncbi:hypothetical protein TrLO_g13696 [Triparma laevis f. longispina]|uniref:Uncharacterized protein n=1 Tax=Triparma laevis f. longispina TaxID=1714387 RepID=A0A9W6ZNH0_9STRA|nr:hypothetical protein TrLO_g13696 [Triparma laevis f. longispina]
MSKSATAESNEDHESLKTGEKHGGEDEEKENGEGAINASSAVTSSTLMTVSTVTATTNQFMHSPEFRRHFVDYIRDDTFMALRFATKLWMRSRTS